MKRILAANLLIIFSLMIIFSAIGCGETKQTPLYSNPQVLTEAGTYPILKDEYIGKIKLKMMGANHAAINPDWANNKFFIRMKNLTGLDFEFEVYGDDMYAEKKSLALSTGNNLPDVFFKANFNNYDEVTYGAVTLRSLNDLIENYAPNIKKILDENEIIRKSITTPDGNIYSLPTMYLNLPEGIENIIRGFFWINKSWLDSLGLDMPRTPEEFLNVMREFREHYCVRENSYPLVMAGIDDLLRLFNFFGLDLSQYWVQGGEDGKLIFGPRTEEFKRALQFIRTLIKENLMNPNWSTLTPAQKQAIGNSGDYYGCFVDAAPQYTVGFAKMRQYVTLDPISESGEGGFWGAMPPLQRGCFSITTACKYPEAAIRWIDTLYDINSIYGLWAIIGAEGEEWQWLDEEKTKWRSTVPDEQYAQIMAKTIIQTGDGMPYAVDESFWEKQQTESDLYIRPLRNRQMRFGKVGYPYVYFAKKELKEISDLAADINNYVRRFIADAIRDDEYLNKNWNTFKAFNRLGLDRYLEILQERYDAFYS